MNAKLAISTLLLAAGTAAAVHAAEPIVTDDFLPAGPIAAHVYVNAANGERIITTPGGSRLGGLFWQNDDAAGSCNFFYGIDRPTRDTEASGRVKFGAAVVHWGDLPAHSIVDAYDVGYYADICAVILGEGTPGLDMINTFFAGYDGLVEPGGTHADLTVSIVVPDILGIDCTLGGITEFFGWYYTIDLEGSGLEFSLDGDDLDHDGLADFGYSYEFVQGQAGRKGIIGPLLVRPSSLGGIGSATGAPDRHEWFNQTTGGPASFSDYVGPFWFGGGDCAVPRPYASFLLNLYGISGDALCARVDFNADGLVDFTDYLEFLTRFDAADVTADLNGDGVVDFPDYLEFLNLFETCKN